MASLSHIAKEANYGKMQYTDHIIDVDTKNRSFIKMFKTLKELNVENNKFFLRLYDPDLKGVDPHSPNLTKDQKSKITVEITKNPYYFLREVIRIPVVGAKYKFELHRGNLALSFCIFNNLDFIVELPRQRYKTVSILCCLLWVYGFATTNTSMLFGNKEASNIKAMIKIFGNLILALPEFLKEAITDAKDTDNVESRIAYKTNNSILASNPPISSEQADKKGRGFSLPILWLDEYAFIKYNEIMFKSAAPAFSTIAAIAKEEGKPHCKIISTTPSNLDLEEGAHCHDLIHDACTFIEDFYDWSLDKIRTYRGQNSANDFMHIKFTWQQLGLTQEWYIKQCRGLLNDKLTIKREIDLEWTKASDNSVFEEEVLDALYSNVKEFKHHIHLDIAKVELVDGTHDADVEELVKITYKVHLFVPLDKDKLYFIGIDTAGGLGKDNSAFVIVDPDTLLPIGYFKNNRINTSYYCSLLVSLIKDHIPKGLLVIESNNYGKNIIDFLLRTDIAKNVYYDIPITDDEKKKTVLLKLNTDKKVYGVSTNTTTRSFMIDILKEIVDSNPTIIICEEIYNDIRTLVFNNRGKVEHERNAHDDVLFSYLFVRYIVKYSNTLHIFLRNAKAIASNTSVLISNSTTLLVGNSTRDFRPKADISLEDYVLLADSEEFGDREVLAKAIIDELGAPATNALGRHSRRINSQIANSIMDGNKSSTIKIDNNIFNNKR